MCRIEREDRSRELRFPLGDPLARMSVVDPAMPDRDRDGDVDIDDLYQHAANPVDLTCDQAIDGDDTRVMQDAVRQNEPADVTTR